MSHKVVTLVYSKRVGSAHRKAILAYMADRASDDGRGVFCSKGTIADEAEIARSTVFKTIRELVNEGVLIEAGSRPCRNGATVVYDLNLDAIRAFPDVKPEVDRSAQRTPTSPPAGPVRSVTSPPAGPYQSASRTPTGPLNGPKPSLEPSLNHPAAAVRAQGDEISPDCLHAEVMAAVGLTGGRIPAHWMPPAATMHVSRWVTDLRLTPAQIIDAARESRKRHAEPPNGPRALDGVMRGLAAAVHAPPMTPAAAASPAASGIDLDAIFARINLDLPT